MNIVTLATAPDAWEVTGLRWYPNYGKNPGVNSQYGCSQPGLPCSYSVQVDDGCHGPDMVNYVFFGTMCGLCRQHFMENKAQLVAGTFLTAPYQFIKLLAMFNRPSATLMTEIWKRWQYGVFSAGGDAALAEKWVRVGFHGWPDQQLTPIPQYPQCDTSCTQPYTAQPSKDGIPVITNGRFTLHLGGSVADATLGKKVWSEDF
jgi:hypothetical protein